MLYTINAPSLTQPTYQTLEKYSMKRFQKLEKFLKASSNPSPEVRIAVNKTGDLFSLTAEVFGKNRTIAKSKDRDLRKTIDKAVDMLRSQITNARQKVRDKKLRSNKILDQVKSMNPSFLG